MTPGAPYHWKDEAAMRALVADIGFGLLCASGPDGPHAVHLPLVWMADDRIGLHLHRANPTIRHLESGSALIVVTGPDAYVSPDWYGLPDKVPTWNYLSVEWRGPVMRLDKAATVTQIDALTAGQEDRLTPKPVWTRHKMSHGQFERMLPGLIGFEMRVDAMRGTAKLGQDKPDAARLSVAAALDQRGKGAIAALMRRIPA